MIAEIVEKIISRFECKYLGLHVEEKIGERLLDTYVEFHGDKLFIRKDIVADYKCMDCGHVRTVPIKVIKDVINKK